MGADACPAVPCPVSMHIGGPQSQRACPKHVQPGLWHKRMHEHGWWRGEVFRKVLGDLRLHCARCELSKQVQLSAQPHFCCARSAE